MIVFASRIRDTLVTRLRRRTVIGNYCRFSRKRPVSSDYRPTHTDGSTVVGRVELLLKYLKKDIVALLLSVHQG